MRHAEIEQLTRRFRRGAVSAHQPPPLGFLAFVRDNSAALHARQPALARFTGRAKSSVQRIHFEPAPELGYLLRQHSRAKWNALPLEHIPCQRKDETLLVSR